MPIESGAKTETHTHFEVFRYPIGPDGPAESAWAGWEGQDDAEADEPGNSAHEQGRTAAESAIREEFDKRLIEESKRFFEAGREKGIQEGRNAEHEAQQGAMRAAAQERMRQAAELMGTFAREHDRFLQAVEREVVDLALAVATRILRREAQMDPLLLTGAVRVALGQLSGSTQVRLRVPPTDLALWTEAMALLPNLAVKPSVEAGEGMRLGDCEIETELGSVDLGIRSQLGEIERGFFDRAGTAKASPRAKTDAGGVAAGQAGT